MRQRPRLAPALCAIFVVGLAAPSVHAAPRPVPKKAPAIPLHPPAPEAEPAVRAAEAQYAEAMRAFEAGDRARARELFVAALGALPPVHVLRAQTLYNLAFLADGDVTDGKLRAACDAQAAYARYLEVAPPELEHAETRAMAQERIAPLAAQCERDRSPEPQRPRNAGADVPDPTTPGDAGGVAPMATALAALAMAGAGVGLQFLAQSAIETRDAAGADYLRTTDPASAHRQAQLARNAQTDAESRATYSYVAFGLAGALAGVAGWLWLSSRSPAAGEVGLSLTPGPGMLVLGGGF